MPENRLYYGDNLDVLRRYVQGESERAQDMFSKMVTVQ